MKREELESLIRQMTLEEKIGQMVQIKAKEILNEATDVPTGPNQKMSKNKSLVYNVGSIISSANSDKIKEIQSKYLKNNRLKIPLLFMSDIVNGYKTIFPCPLAQGCSWNTELIRKTTEISRNESLLGGINVVFSPMLDLVRDARWGRCMESFGGEDPFLAKSYAKIITEEYQKDNRQACCIKHFAAYGAVEAGRDYNTVDISKRELLESYLQGYKSSINSGAKLVMTSFNIVNGIPSTINKWLLNDLLRKEWGFGGVIISDHSSIQECVNHGVAENEKEAALKAIEAGVDIDMLSNCYADNLKTLVEEHKISIDRINESVLRILTLKNDLGLFENPYRNFNKDLEVQYVLCDENLKEALKTAEECMVLLKNKDNILPLKQDAKVALIGPYSDNRKFYSSWTIFCNAENNKTLKEVFEERHSNFLCSKGCEILEEPELKKLIDIQNDNVKKFNSGKYEAGNINESIEIAKKSDVIVLAIGEHYLQSGEACSRSKIELPKIQVRLIDELSKLNKPIIAVLFNGRPLQLNNIENKVDAILDVWMPGLMGSEAIYNILFGEANPSGKLTMSFPQNSGQCPIYYNHYNTGRPNFKEYRYESRYLDIPTKSFYPFGYGLSYSNFIYSNLVLSNKHISKGLNITVSVTVRNESNFAGEEVVQLYIQDLVGSVVRPVKELKGFKKVFFEPYEEKIISFEITEDMLKFYNENFEYRAEIGKFKVFVGGNSRDTIEDRFEYFVILDK